MSHDTHDTSGIDHATVYDDAVAVDDVHTTTYHPFVGIVLHTSQGTTDVLTGRAEQTSVQEMTDGNRYASVLVHLDTVLEAPAPGNTTYREGSISSNHVLVMVSDPADVPPRDARRAVYLTDSAVSRPVGMLGTLTEITRLDRNTTDARDSTDNREGTGQ